MSAVALAKADAPAVTTAGVFIFPPSSSPGAKHPGTHPAVKNGIGLRDALRRSSELFTHAGAHRDGLMGRPDASHRAMTVEVLKFSPNELKEKRKWLMRQPLAAALLQPPRVSVLIPTKVKNFAERTEGRAKIPRAQTLADHRSKAGRNRGARARRSSSSALSRGRGQPAQGRNPERTQVP